jgi:hypothetical protein
MLRQVASFIGALLILIAYAGHQMDWMDPRKRTYVNRAYLVLPIE